MSPSPSLLSRLFDRKSNLVPDSLTEALGSTFNEHELRSLSRLGTVVELEAGATLTTEGRPGREAIVIIDGSAAVSRGDEVIATVSTGAIIGEAALLSGEPRNATVVATTPLTIAALNSAEFSTLLSDCPRLDAHVQELAAQRSAA